MSRHAENKSKSSNLGQTVILRCTCVHEFQESRYAKKYGRGARVHNIGKTYKTCTVCGRTQ